MGVVLFECGKKIKLYETTCMCYIEEMKIKQSYVHVNQYHLVSPRGPNTRYILNSYCGFISICLIPFFVDFDVE